MFSLMLGLAFAQDAPADDTSPGLWVGVGFGPHEALLHRDLISRSGGVEIEGGADLGPVQVGAHLRSTSMNVLHYTAQLDALGAPMAPGDGTLVGVGLVARAPVEFGSFVLAPRVAAGPAVFRSPMDPERFQAELVQGEWGGESPAMGLRQFGGFASGGVDFGLRVHDNATLFIGVRGGVAYTGLFMAGLDGAIGAVAQF